MEFEAYFDESESTGNVPRVYTIAGYVSTKDRWTAFVDEWQDFLNREGLPPFSMKNFCNPHHSLYGKMTQNKRTAVLRILHRILKKHYLMSFSSSVSLGAFYNLTPPQRLALGSPHDFVTFNCLKNLAYEGPKFGLHGQIHYYFEAGSRYQRHLSHLIETAPSKDRAFYRIGGVSFGGKELQPLQAADMLAYETRKEMCRRLDSSKKREMRKSLINLYDRRKDYWVFLEEGDLDRIFEGQEISAILNDPEFVERAHKAAGDGLFKKL